MTEWTISMKGGLEYPLYFLFEMLYFKRLICLFSSLHKEQIVPCTQWHDPLTANGIQFRRENLVVITASWNDGLRSFFIALDHKIRPDKADDTGIKVIETSLKDRIK
jgi:hypothetical protein